MLDLDPSRAPPLPRDAATVIVLRDGAAGPEVLCVKRHGKSGFLGGAVVFPGGKVDDADAHPDWSARLGPLEPRASALGGERPAAFAVAALRELLEEAALLPTEGAPLPHERVLALRDELGATGGAAAFAELCARHALSPSARGLRAFARWITPRAEARRFDTRFYLLEAPAGQEGAHDRRETTESFWGKPAQVLELWAAGELFLAPPTSRALEILAPAGSVAEAMALAAQQPLDPVCPHFTEEGGVPMLVVAGDPLYPEPAPPPADPTAPTRFVLEGTRFVARRA